MIKPDACLILKKELFHSKEVLLKKEVLSSSPSEGLLSTNASCKLSQVGKDICLQKTMSYKDGGFLFRTDFNESFKSIFYIKHGKILVHAAVDILL